MRCKNCGAENDDSRYICEVCGSPLYDEESIEPDDSEKTQTFSAVKGGEYNNDGYNNSNNNYNSNNTDNNSPAPQKHGGNRNDEPDGKAAEKKSIIVIAILAVILIAIIASVVVVASNKSKSNTEETELTKYSTTAGSSTTTTARETTEATTETTTEKTTEKTTQTLWIINTSSSGGGETTGDGTYENGKKVTLVATPDSGYTFDGWYSDGVKVSSKKKYTFTANENASFSAVFTAETSAEQDTSTSSGEVIFGE